VTLCATDGHSLRSQFSARAPRYDARTAWIDDEELASALRTAMVGVHPDASCVDLGTGTGALIRHAGSFGRWVGIDISGAMLREAHLDWAVVGTAEAVPLRDSSTDLVAARSVLYYTDIARTLAEIKRILRPGGRCLILEKVVGRFQGSSLDWLRTLESARNPLKQRLRSTEDLIGLAVSNGLTLVGKRELDRLYSQSYSEWLAAIPGEVNQARVQQIALQPPVEVRQVGFRAFRGGSISFPITWAVLELGKALT
jgi:SAM-dependent methyltransferase